MEEEHYDWQCHGHSGGKVVTVSFKNCYIAVTRKLRFMGILTCDLGFAY